MKGIRECFNARDIGYGILAIDEHGEDTMYLVTGSCKSLLIDTGWGVGDLKSILFRYTDKPLTVINTHGHPDHVGGDFLFSEVHIHSADIPILMGCYSAEARRFDLDRLMAGGVPEGFSEAEWLGGRPGEVIPVEEGKAYDLGGRKLEIIRVPGHTPGCIALLDDKSRMLFIGDSVLEGDLWMYLKESLPLEDYLSSLRKLDEISDRYDFLLPAHSRTPLDKRIVRELTEGVQSILQGRAVGTPTETFVGSGLLARFQTCGIIYDEKKLFSRQGSGSHDA